MTEGVGDKILAEVHKCRDGIGHAFTKHTGELHQGSQDAGETYKVLLDVYLCFERTIVAIP